MPKPSLLSEKEKFFEILDSGKKRETFEYITYFAYGNFMTIFSL